MDVQSLVGQGVSMQENIIIRWETLTLPELEQAFLGLEVWRDPSREPLSKDLQMDAGGVRFALRGAKELGL